MEGLYMKNYVINASIAGDSYIVGTDLVVTSDLTGASKEEVQSVIDSFEGEQLMINQIMNINDIEIDERHYRYDSYYGPAHTINVAEVKDNKIISSTHAKFNKGGRGR